MNATTETKTKHTPGPWILDYDKGTTQDILSRKHGGICTVRRAGRHNNETFAANARLIAAAPAMKETLEYLAGKIAHIRRALVAKGQADFCNAWGILEAEDAARAAIAQAEGGAQ